MTTPTTNDAVAAFQAECGVRICPGCGTTVEGAGRGYTGKTFCSTTCRQGFNNRMKAEGAPIAALVKAWTMTRHAKPGSREAEVCRYARSQLTQIAAEFNERDDEAGRPSAVAYVETLMAMGTLYCDRAAPNRAKGTKRPKPAADHPEAQSQPTSNPESIAVKLPNGEVRFFRLADSY